MISDYHQTKLDRKISAIIKDRKRCEKCHKVRDLDPTHVFSRRYINTRWCLINVRAWCRECHDWAHANPNEFKKWIIKKIGQIAYDDLRKKAYMITAHFYETEDEKINRQLLTSK